MENSGAPVILLLGGAPGTGKTTMANALVQELGLVHHVSTGFIREIARTVITDDRASLLQGFSFDAWRLVQGPAADNRNIFAGALAQARLLQPAIEACIQRSRREGSSLVLEGAHLLPGLLNSTPLGVSLFCILDVPHRETLAQRVLGPTHIQRHLSRKQISSIMELQEACIQRAQECGIPVVENTNLAHAMAQVKELLKNSTPLSLSAFRKVQPV